MVPLNTPWTPSTKSCPFLETWKSGVLKTYFTYFNSFLAPWISLSLQFTVHNDTGGPGIQFTVYIGPGALIGVLEPPVYNSSSGALLQPQTAGTLLALLTASTILYCGTSLNCTTMNWTELNWTELFSFTMSDNPHRAIQFRAGQASDDSNQWNPPVFSAHHNGPCSTLETL